MKRLAIAIALVFYVVHIPIVKDGAKIGRLTYLAKTFDTAADCENFLKSAEFTATLPQAKEAVGDEGDLGDPYCEVVE